MTAKQIYNNLCLIADQLNVKVIKGKGNFKSGSCLVKEESIIVINHNQPFEGRIRNLALSLLEFDLSASAKPCPELCLVSQRLA